MVAVSAAGIARSGFEDRRQAALQRPGAFISERKYRGSHSVNNETIEKVPLTQNADPPKEALPLTFVEHRIQCAVELPCRGVSGLVDLPKCRDIQRIGQHDGSLRVPHVTNLSRASRHLARPV